jgi:CDGSH-type Zn-finger protein
MEDPKIAQKVPYKVEVEEGKTYAWCACGLSKTQPYCDGSHKPTSFKPDVFKAEVSGTVHLCGCKATKNPPYCDGTHNHLY